VFEAATWVKSMYMKNHDRKPETRRKYGIQIIFYIILHVVDGLGMEFTAC